MHGLERCRQWDAPARLRAPADHRPRLSRSRSEISSAHGHRSHACGHLRALWSHLPGSWLMRAFVEPLTQRHEACSICTASGVRWSRSRPLWLARHELEAEPRIPRHPRRELDCSTGGGIRLRRGIRRQIVIVVVSAISLTGAATTGALALEVPPVIVSTYR